MFESKYGKLQTIDASTVKRTHNCLEYKYIKKDQRKLNSRVVITDIIYFIGENKMLIMCPECGNKVSEFASNCVHCGCPMSVIVEITQNIKNVDNILDELFDKLALSDQTKMVIMTWFRYDGCLIIENNELSYINNSTFKARYYKDNPNESPYKLFEKYLKYTENKSIPKDLEGFLKYKLEITKLQTSIDSLKSIGLDEEEIDIICSYILRELYRDFDFSFDTKIRRPVI